MPGVSEFPHAKQKKAYPGRKNGIASRDCKSFLLISMFFPRGAPGSATAEQENGEPGYENVNLQQGWKT